MAKKRIEKTKARKNDVNPYVLNAVAPSRLEFYSNYGITDDTTFFRPLTLLKYKNEQSLGWGEGFVANKHIKAPVAIVCYPENAGKLADDVNRAINKSLSTVGEGMMSHTDIMRKQIEGEQAERIANMLLRDNAKVFSVVPYVILRSDEKELLSSQQGYLESAVQNWGNNVAPQISNTRAAFFGASPLVLPDPYTRETRAVPMPSTTLGWGGFLSQPGMDDLAGIELGVDNHGGIIRLNIELNTEARPNSNIIVIGETGSGKSTLIKFILLMETALYGSKILVVGDPEGEYAREAIRLGGEVSSAEDSKISPFEPRCIGNIDKADEEDDGSLASNEEIALAHEQALTERVLSSTIPFLKTFLGMAFSIPKELMDFLTLAVEYTYADYGIGLDMTFREYYEGDYSYPVMEDLYHKLEDLAEANPANESEFSRLAMAIRSAAVGYDAHLWNTRTSFNPQTNFTVIDTQGLSQDEDVMRAQYYNIFTWAWSQVRAQRFDNNYIRLVVDELHTILSPKSVEASYQIRNITQRIRKYGGGTLFATQTVSTLFDPAIESSGRAVLDNSAYKFFGKSSGNVEGGNLWYIKNLIHLPEDVATKLSETGRGRFIVAAGREKSWVQVNAIKDWQLDLFGQGGGR